MVEPYQAYPDLDDRCKVGELQSWTRLVNGRTMDFRSKSPWCEGSTGNVGSRLNEIRIGGGQAGWGLVLSDIARLVGLWLSSEN